MKKFFPIACLLFLTNTTSAQISSATFGMMEARHIGPATMGGRLTAIEGVNSEPRTIYIGSAGGGVWKTTNAGVSFKSIFDKYCQSIGALAIDQQNPKIIFVGTGESNMRNSVSIGDGLYRSTDEGENWTKIKGLDSTEHISRIIIDPLNSKNIYVAAPGPLWSDSKHRGLYKSTDGGNTFEKILYINEQTGVADIAVNPANPSIVYATTWQFRRTPYSFNSGGKGSGIYKSIDGGKTWRELSKGLPPKPFGRTAIALAPSAPDNLLAIVEAENTGLYISSDGGENWKQQSATVNVVSRPFYFACLVIDPKDPKRVYRPGFGFSYSSDGGYSFADGGGNVHADHHALWINPNYTNQMYLGTDGGLYVSNDRGANWLMLPMLPVSQFYHVTYDFKQPYNVYGGLQDNQSWYAPTQSAGGIENNDWKNLGGGDGFWVQVDGINPDIVYSESQGGEIVHNDLKLGKAYSIKPQQALNDEKLRFNWNTPIVIGQKNKRNLYIASQYLYKSVDEGKNWIKISPDLTTNNKDKQKQEESGGLSADVTSAENHCTIFTIAESPLDENLVWAGTDDGNLQYTTDGGKNWTNVAKNYTAAGIPAQTWVSSIEPSRFDRNVVYASFDNHMYGDHKTYLAKSIDMGKTWTLFKSEEFTGFAHKIKEDNVNKDLLFAGTEMGLFASLDGGSNWFRMKNNIPWMALVRDIQIHPVTNDLILATHGRGIIIVDNITPMRNMTKEMAAKDVVVFNSKPINITMGKYYIGSGNGDGYIGTNSSQQAPIEYYFKDRVSRGEVKVEIYDKDGKLVQSIPGSKRKGINIVNWNMRGTPPKVASGGTKLDVGGFIAPMVLPGEYTVKLKVADKVYENKLTMQRDPDSDMTLADMEDQYNTAMQLYNMHVRLGKLVDSISANQKMLQQALDKLKNNKVKKLVQEYHDKLEDLRSKLLATKQKSLFADEKMLREDISDVYVSVCNQETRPSNLQKERTVVLLNRVGDAEKANASINKQYEEKVKALLLKEKIDKIENTEMKKKEKQ
ncbi:MAG: hypothetical protein KF741_12525 [Ferruginibacter sp.]|nr:glycosyl hydrolase [Bacteroidota bacterium]MBX2920060.1 hypothetical protein [Ferruginibacter sp.]MCB0710077.1 hypothetical protein [Chitinophagaceae bacterium]